ncbi:hypothetical protein R5W24_004562 [Gemmata sp. JC717]|uniref:hypothetical protein n=1 Tax=Gemmata algarum TaxID=2975278 RepID=UPI0021BAD94E|nr:hypothetical protein [Gemmata algarum]MDY3555419.1 hypothetical protein [Gemmata algarum]
MNLLYPALRADQLAPMVRVSLVCALVAGAYGALHDQISYAISPEYFTKLKVHQFAYADFGWPPRAFASAVGFLGTWWVGLLAGWFLSRAGLVELPPERRRRCLLRAFGLVLFGAAAGGLAGATVGVVTTRDGDLRGWQHWRTEIGIEDLRGFAIVAQLHAGGYLGALAGAAFAFVDVRRQRTRLRTEAGAPGHEPPSAATPAPSRPPPPQHP